MIEQNSYVNKGVNKIYLSVVAALVSVGDLVRFVHQL